MACRQPGVLVSAGVCRGFFDGICALQDLKCMVFSLIGAHFKIQPIQR